MTPTCPTTGRLKLLIKASFDDLPDPDPARIQRIASTLNRKQTKPVQPRRAWLFWLLLGGSMTAMAWWAGHSITPTSLDNEKTNDSSTNGQTLIPHHKPAKQQAPTKPHDMKPSPIIDQREHY